MRNLFVCLCLAVPFSLHAARIVSTSADFRSAVASAAPGDTILLRPGAYDLGGPVVVTRSGLQEHPIVLGGLRRGRTELRGDSRFFLDAVSHVVVKGFVFASSNGPAVRLRGCRHVRVTRNIFRLRESAPSLWLLITGLPGDTSALSSGNRIDHNLFEKKREIGNFLTVEGTRGSGFQVSQDDTIDHNHFRDIGPRVENALEAIRIGSSDFSLSSGRTLIENNLFERCDGDPEYVSIKSSDNVIRRNTFRECLGVLSLRHGNRNRVEGNYFLGNGRAGTFRDSTGRVWRLGTGGIRFCGDSMVIRNNYFEGLTGRRWDATLAVASGDADYGDGKPLTKHFRIRNALIAFNTFVDNASTIEIGYDGEGFQGNWWRLPPMGLTVANNILVAKRDTIVRIFTAPVESHWEGNILFAGKKAAACNCRLEGVTVRNPELRRVGGVWRPARAGAAIGGGTGASSPPGMGGNGRPLSLSDVGPASPE